MVGIMFFIYAGVAAAAIIILVLMAIFGGLDLDFDIDLGDADFDIDGGGGIGLPVILAFVAVFGGVSSILSYFGVNAILTPIIGAVSAFLLAFLLFLAIRYFLKIFSADSTVKYNKLVGKKATVTIKILPGQEGQITLFTDQRGRTLIPAVSSKLVRNNAEVIISEALGDVVKVVPLNEWKGEKKTRKKINKKEKR